MLLRNPSCTIGTAHHCASVLPPRRSSLPPPLPPFHPLPLPPSRFSLNIDPMDVHEVAMRLEVIQLDVSMQWKLQAEVASVQASFLYNDTLPQSALHQVR